MIEVPDRAYRHNHDKAMHPDRNKLAADPLDGERDKLLESPDRYVRACGLIADAHPENLALLMAEVDPVDFRAWHQHHPNNEKLYHRALRLGLAKFEWNGRLIALGVVTRRGQGMVQKNMAGDLKTMLPETRSNTKAARAEIGAKALPDDVRKKMAAMSDDELRALADADDDDE